MKIIKLREENFEKIFKTALRTLQEGEVIVGPSDTVYGLYGDAQNEKALKKIFQIKKRPFTKPIPLFVRDLKMAKKFAKISKDQEAFLKKVWPGPVTVVLGAKKELPYVTFRGTIGLRMPDSKFLLGILEKIGHPLAQSSANISGKPATTKIQKVINYFQNQKVQPALILDAGNLKPARPSAVIALTKREKRILRE